MKIMDFVSQLDEVAINEEFVANLARTYNVKKLPDEVKRLISAAQDGIFFDEGGHLLPLEDILSASSDLHTDFVSAGVIPLIDTGENNYVSYNFKGDSWNNFNIVEGASFCTKDSLPEILNSIYGATEDVSFELPDEKIQMLADIMAQYAPEAWTNITLEARLKGERLFFESEAMAEDDAEYNVSIDHEDSTKLTQILFEDMKRHSCQYFQFELTSDGDYSITFA